MNNRYAVRLHLKTGNMNPCSICVYVAFSEQAAHQFYADRHYPLSYSYSVRQLVTRAEVEEEPDKYTISF